MAFCVYAFGDTTFSYESRTVLDGIFRRVAVAKNFSNGAATRFPARQWNRGGDMKYATGGPDRQTIHGRFMPKSNIRSNYMASNGNAEGANKCDSIGELAVESADRRERSKGESERDESSVTAIRNRSFLRNLSSVFRPILNYLYSISQLVDLAFSLHTLYTLYTPYIPYSLNSVAGYL